jgi:hypothetical protein
LVFVIRRATQPPTLRPYNDDREPRQLIVLITNPRLLALIHITERICEGILPNAVTLNLRRWISFGRLCLIPGDDDHQAQCEISE